MSAIYNELDAFPAAWMRNLITAGHIAPGVVDERSIKDLAAADVAGPGQRHFFAGIGVWSYALRLAGVSDDSSIWTGSCPCQPFSGAGKRGGFDDERHLWPVWFELIRECRPAIVFGEQVASPDGLTWLDAVFADLEGAGYSVGAADLCAAGVGAPHIRQRLYFVAYTSGQRLDGVDACVRERRPQQSGAETPRSGKAIVGRLAAQRDGTSRDRMGNANATRLEERPSQRRNHGAKLSTAQRAGSAIGEDRNHSPVAASAARGYWSNAEWIPCRDGKYRPVEPGTFPLAHGAPARVGRLRGYGNAINAEQAATFIEAALGSIATLTAPPGHSEAT